MSGEDDEGDAPFELNGLRYFARWMVAVNLMTVHVDGFKTPQTRQVNNLDHDWLARDIGRAIVRAG